MGNCDFWNKAHQFIIECKLENADHSAMIFTLVYLEPY